MSTPRSYILVWLDTRLFALSRYFYVPLLVSRSQRSFELRHFDCAAVCSCKSEGFNKSEQPFVAALERSRRAVILFRVAQHALVLLYITERVNNRSKIRGISFSSVDCILEMSCLKIDSELFYLYFFHTSISIH